MPRVFEAPPGYVLNPDYLVPELRAQRDALLEALKLAVRQNEHDMLMTGEECRQCRAALKKAEENT